MSLTSQEVYIQGEPISRGIAIGHPFFFEIVENDVAARTIAEGEVEAEIARFRAAVDRCRDDCVRIRKQLEGESAVDAAAILETHLQLLQDQSLTHKVELQIAEECRNAEAALQAVLLSVKERFDSLPDPFFRERFKDVSDIGRRMMSYLCGDGRSTPLADAPPGSIVFADELPASDAAEVEASKVGAFVTASGGATAHAAIVAKAKGLPCISQVDLALVEYYKEQEVIVDGRTGEIILNPHETTLLRYRKLQQELEGYFQHLATEQTNEAETYDGYRVRLSANIELVSEASSLHTFGGSGVGLFRSEYIFLAKDCIPSEDEQYEIYRDLVTAAKGLPVTIRAFDIGGDKAAEVKELKSSGFDELKHGRSLRFLLRERGILKTQLRAVLRASAHGEVNLLFPMVSGLSELQEAKMFVKDAQAELDRAGIEYRQGIGLGCMVEIPSAVVMIDCIARECDFLSIGTNDLVQYSLAADRVTQSAHVCYSPMNPAIVRMIKVVIAQANRYGIPVTVCGEVASDPRFTVLLVGLGVSELSVSCNALPIIKNAIRSISLVEAAEVAERALDMHHAEDVEQLLAAHYRKTVPEDHYYNC